MRPVNFYHHLQATLYHSTPAQLKHNSDVELTHFVIRPRASKGYGS